MPMSEPANVTKYFIAHGYQNHKAFWRHNVVDLVKPLLDVVDKLPTDVDGDPIEDGKSYFFRCANGALEFVAYLGPRNVRDGVLSYPWHEAHKTREAAEEAKP